MSSSFSKRRDDFFKNHRRFKSNSSITACSGDSADEKIIIPSLIPTTSEESNTSRSLNLVPMASEESNTSISSYEQNKSVPRSSSLFRSGRSASPFVRGSASYNRNTPAPTPNNSAPRSGTLTTTRSSSTPRSIIKTEPRISTTPRIPTASTSRGPGIPTSRTSALPRGLSVATSGSSTTTLPRSSSTPRGPRAKLNITTKDDGDGDGYGDDDDDDKSVSSNYSYASSYTSSRGRSLLDRSRQIGQTLKSRKKKDGEFNEKNMITQVDILHDQFSTMEMKSENFEQCYTILRKYDSMMKFMADKVMDNKNSAGNKAGMENRIAALQVNNTICKTSYEEVVKSNTSLNATLSEKVDELEHLNENTYMLAHVNESLSTNLKESEDENNCLRNELNIVKDQTTTMKKSLDSQKETAQSVQDAIQKLTTSMEEQLQSKEDQIEKLSNDLWSTTQEHALQEQTVKAQRCEILEWKEISKQEKEEYEHYDQEIESQYQQTLSIFKQEIEMLKETLNNNEEFSSKLLEEAHAQNDRNKYQHEEEISNMETQHQKEVSLTKKQLDDAEQKLERESNQREEVLTELEDTNYNLEKSQNQIGSLESNVCKLNKQIEQYKASNTAEDISRTALLKALKLEADTQQRLASAMIEELQQTVEMKDIEAEEGKEQLTKLEETNKEHLEHLDRLEELNTIQQEGMEDEITKVHEELTNEITTLHNELDEAHDILQRKEHLYAKIQEERDTLREHFNESCNEKEALHEELATIQELSSNWERELLSKREEVEKLNENVELKQTHADQLAEDLKSMNQQNTTQQQTIEQIRDELMKSNSIIQNQRSQNTTSKECYLKHEKEIENQYQQTLSLFKQEIARLKETHKKNEDRSSSLMRDSHSQADMNKKNFDKEVSNITKKYQQENSVLKTQLKDVTDIQKREENQIKNLTKELEGAVEKCTGFESSLVSQEKSIADVQKQLQKQKEKCVEQNTRNTQLMELKQEAESRQRTANSTIDQLKEYIEKKDLELEKLQKQLDELNKGNHDDYKGMEEEITKVREQLTNEIVGLQDQIEDTQQNIRRKEYIVTEIQQEKDALCDQLSASYDERETLQQELLKVKSEMVNTATTSDSTFILEQRLQERQKEIDHLRNQIEELQLMRPSMNDDKTSNECGIIQHLEQKVASLTDEIYNFKTKNTLLLREMDQLKKTMSERNKESDAYSVSTACVRNGKTVTNNDEILEMLVLFIEKNLTFEHDILDGDLHESMFNKANFIQKQERIINSLEKEVMEQTRQLEEAEDYKDDDDLDNRQKGRLTMGAYNRKDVENSVGYNIQQMKLTSTANADILEVKASLMEGKKDADFKLKEGFQVIKSFLHNLNVRYRTTFDQEEGMNTDKIKGFLVSQMQVVFRLRNGLKKLTEDTHNQQSMNQRKIEDLLMQKMQLLQMFHEHQVLVLEQEKQNNLKEMKATDKKNTDRIKSLEVDMESDREIVNSLKSQSKQRNEESKKQESILQSEIEKLQQDAFEHSAEISRLTKAKQELEEAIRMEYESNVDILKSENMCLAAKVIDVETELKLLQKHSAKMLEESAKVEEETNGYIFSLQKEKDKVQDDLSSQLKENRRTIDTLENALSLQKKTVVSLRSEMKQLMRDMEHELLANKEEQEGTQHVVHISHVKITQLEEENDLLIQDITNQKAINFDLKEEMKHFHEAMKACKEKLSTMEENAESLKFEMKKQVQNHAEHEEELKKDIQNGKNEASEIEQEKNKYKQGIHSLKKETVIYRQNHLNLNAETARLNTKLQRTAKLLQDSKLYVDQLEGDLVNNQEKLEDKLSAFEILSKDADRLRVELQTSQKELMDAERQILRTQQQQHRQRRNKALTKQQPKLYGAQIVEESSIVMETPRSQATSIVDKVEKTFGRAGGEHRLRRAEVEKQIGQLNDSLQASSSFFDDTESYASIPSAVNKIRKDVKSTNGSGGSKTARVTTAMVHNTRNQHYQGPTSDKYPNYYDNNSVYVDDESTITCSIVSSAFEQPKQRIFYENSVTYHEEDESDSVEDKENDLNSLNNDNISAVSSRRYGSNTYGSQNTYKSRR